MPVFRVERTKNFTVMSNHHLRDKTISLKAKGLLSQMLSLPNDWDYTLRGLAAINKESIDAVRTAVHELEAAGYVVRSRIRDERGPLRGCDYFVYEYPHIEDKVLQETYIMTSVGNNDRGTLIVPDSVTASLEKDVNALLVQYKPDADSNEVLQKMIPIGLDSTHGYRYAEKNMMYETFYGLDALVSFLCCYIGLVFLLICAALLALKQLTETTDNVYRYGLLQKLGAGHRQINHTLFVQTVVFFAIPLVVAGVYSAFLIGKAMAVVEEFMNIHIATNIGLTIVLFLLVYGSYFLATYLSCKRIVTEQRDLEA